MQSHPVKRVVSGALAASAVIAAVVVGQPLATASPSPFPQTPPTGSSQELAKYRELAGQAEKLNEQYLNAKEDLKAKQAEYDKATADLEGAKQSGASAAGNEAQYRVEVDKFAGASFTSGAQLNKLSALLSGGSVQQFLDRITALDVLAKDKNQALQGLTGAVQQATTAQQQAADAQGRAQAAKDAAAQLLADVDTRKKDLDAQVKQLEVADGTLSAADRAAQRDTGGSAPDVKAPGPKAQAAVNAALSKLGSAYSLGKAGPSQFDCSGLTSWAFRQAGIGIPRTAAQQQGSGTPVAREQLQPGDLVFFGSPAYHVGMYIGGGKMVHSPQPGEVVKISPLISDYSGGRRYA
ncbi:NlpC/P60 family protein [Amycolatopsis nigrescens]|uniref:C40 family peptidase n=1 Tax=Amycolatopsis nigrescens TaxID=381445 RepID=UPI0003A5DA11|nr:NlpC/P60 family protein [Amycolatopsis nigrescens]